MESFVPTTTTAMPTVTSATLVAIFATIPDPRRAASVTYPLPAMLALTVAALLCAQTSVLAMAEWAARQPTDLLEQLGFPARQTPCQSTVHRLLGKVDAHALAAALRTAFDRPAPHDRGAEGGSPSTARRSEDGCSSRASGVRSICSRPSVRRPI
jgi:hypothetical protein